MRLAGELTNCWENLYKDDENLTDVLVLKIPNYCISRIKNKLKAAEDALKELRNSFNHLKSEVGEIKDQHEIRKNTPFSAREAHKRLPRQVQANGPPQPTEHAVRH